ncbi:MAG: hypothetical protein JKY18_04185 [Flavobacteriales bacterium]|nr:hypothetical protein [Flavobacteriales bacterium]
MTISSCVEHPPLVLVQRRVAKEGAAAKPVTPELGSVSVVMVAVPLTTVHSPVPTVMVLPANVVVAAETD